MAQEVLRYCPRCGYWHAYCTRPPKRGFRRRRGPIGSVLYAALRALFWTR
jgi:hypothetical protein